MKIKYKLKQSTSNFKNHFVRDSKVIVAGTLFMFMLFSVVNVSAVSYKIVYDDNVVSDMPEDVKGTTMNDSENISSDKPTRDGYSFLKWCTQVPASDGTCPGTAYDAGVALPIVGTSKNEYRLYAMWEEDVLTMQSATASKLATLMPNTGDTATLIDARDSQEYTIAKLADGKCWMTTNLNLAGGTEIESTKSDVPEGYTLPTANGFQSGNKLPASATASFDDNTKAFVYNSGNKTTNCSSLGCYSYYSWTAATAGSGLSITADNTDAEYSICPNGWRLPNTRTGTDSTSDFRALMIAYGGTSSRTNYTSSTNPTGATMYGKIGPSTTAPGFLLAGTYVNGSFSGSGGGYWSATSASSALARFLYFNSSGVYSADNIARRGGCAIRCVFGE